MTTGTSLKPPTDLRNWALAQLDLQPGASNDEARRIIFRRLSELDFVPPGAWDSALRVADIAPSDGAVDGPVFVPGRRAVEEALRAEVETFAAKFFSLPPEVRIARYHELVKQVAAMSAVTARLQALWPGLELPCELPGDHPPEVIEIVNEVRRLFVLPRQERASRRLAFLQQCRTNWRHWQRAAIAVQAKMARVASLEPALFRELCTSDNREKAREKIARQRRRSLQNGRVPTTTTRSSSASANNWWVGIVVGLALAIVRLLGNSPNPSPKPPPVVSSQPFIDIQKRLKQQEAERAARPGRLPSNPAESLRATPEKTPSRQPNLSLPPLPPGIEIRIEKSAEEAQEMLRQLRQQQSPGVDVRISKSLEEAQEVLRPLEELAQGGQRQQRAPLVETRTFHPDQVRELLRQLREQQAQHGPNPSGDSAIGDLKKALDQAARKSQK